MIPMLGRLAINVDVFEGSDENIGIAYGMQD